MKPTYSLLSFLIVILILGCKKKPNVGRTGPYEHPAFMTTSTGDTVLTGIPINVEGQKVLAHPPGKEKKVKLSINSKIVPIESNISYSPLPQKVLIPKKLKTATPGKDGIPVPKRVRIEPKIIQALHPKPIKVPEPEISEKARKLIQQYEMGSVWAFHQDRKGYIWMGRWFDGSGLSRFDGTNLVYYTSKEGLKGKSIAAIAEDKKGNIWFSTIEGGFSRFDGRNFYQYDVECGLAITHTRSLSIDSKGNVWIATWGKGIIKFQPDEDGYGGYATTYSTQEGMIGNEVYCIAQDLQGNIWATTNKTGVAKFDGHTFTHYTTKEGLLDNEVMYVLVAKNGDIWLGTVKGASKLIVNHSPTNASTNESPYFLNYGQDNGLSKAIFCMMQSKDGRIWFGTYGEGVKVLNETSQIENKLEWESYDYENGLSVDNIFALLEDNDGNVWIGTGKKTNLFRKDFPITYFPEKNEITSQELYSLEGDTLGNLWMSAWVDGLIRIDEHAFEVYQDSDRKVLHRINSIKKDKYGNLWLLAIDGALSSFSPASGIVNELTMHPVPSGSHYTLFWDQNDSLVIGGYNGLFRKELDHFIRYSEKNGLIRNRITDGLVTRKNETWVSGPAGVLKIEDTQHDTLITHYTINEGLGGDLVDIVFLDYWGNHWMTTSSGVTQFDGKNFASLSEKNGLISEGAFGIVQDKHLNIWISSTNGLNLLVPKGDTILLSRPDTYQVFGYGPKDGITKWDINLFLDQKGRLWKMGEHAINLDLEHFPIPNDSPKGVQLTHIEINNQFLSHQSLQDTRYRSGFTFGENLFNSFDSTASFNNYPLDLDLPHDINHLTFYCSALDWQAPHKLTYSFRLKGQEDDWSIPQVENKVDYRNISPGEYTFQVKAIGAAQKWSDTFEYTFTVRPPFWATWWAYMLYFFLLVGTIRGIQLYELNRRLAKAESNRLRELDEVKTRLYTNITHEFRTPITVIQGMTDKIRSHENEKILIRRNSQQLLDLVNQMLDLSKLEAGKLELDLVHGDILSYLRYITESFHSHALLQKINLTFYSSLESLEMDYDPNKILQVLSNLVANAIKFTPELGKVQVTAHQREENLILDVKDTGAGIPWEQLPHIFDRFYQTDDSLTRSAEGTGIGLALVKELVELMDGTVSVKSEVGRGSTFSILIPIRKIGKKVSQPSVLTFQIDKTKNTLAENVLREGPMTIPGADLEKAIALVVEDNLDVMHYLASCLDKDYELHFARNGREGIERALACIPDIIISDVMMPEVDGFTLLQTLKADERTSHVPIILLTAKADYQSKIEGLEHGADAYLTKPFHKEELDTRLRKLIELRRRLQQKYAKLEGPFEPQKFKEDTYITKVKEIILKQYSDENFGVPQLVDALNQERTTVYRKLKALTGKSASKIIMELRLQEAYKLLQSTERNVSEVAFATGFKDVAHFSNEFLKQYGTRPGRIKKPNA